MLLGACVLTAEDFAPPVAREPRPEPPAAPDAGPLSCPAGAECCAGLPCAPGQVCSENTCRPVDAGDACEGVECPSLSPPIVAQPSREDGGETGDAGGYVAPSCTDGVQNGSEPFADCGNTACGPCSLGQSCGADEHCETGFCELGLCADPGRCDDDIRNGRETSVDCGGGSCPVCPDLSLCTSDSDCFNDNCDERGICISCGDATINGTETDIDCGGDDPYCIRCVAGQRCLVDSDCASGSCLGNLC
jgi:hypothetical protein